VKRVLLTGMSGTGRSTIVRELVARGYKAIDADDGWTEPLPDGSQRWREDAIGELLDAEDAEVLFLAGCEENQVAFLPRFDEVILLSAPRETLMQRLDTRPDNPFGKRPGERERILRDLENVEPGLRAIADHEIRTTASLEDIVRSILALVDEPSHRATSRSKGVDIRPLGRAELELVSEILANRPAAMHRDRLEQQERGIFTYLIAWDDDRPIGHVGITWPDDRRPARELEWGAEIAKVHDLEVDPAHRNRGVGRAMMLELEERVRARGIADIGLSTGPGEYFAPARNLYGSLGYAERPGTLHIVSSRSVSGAPEDAYLDTLTCWFKNL
jgi:GNAT superfamily N-acetyltransferase/dephospho-CoA kinase